jgi:hypothetical protein
MLHFRTFKSQKYFFKILFVIKYSNFSQSNVMFPLVIETEIS